MNDLKKFSIVFNSVIIGLVLLFLILNLFGAGIPLFWVFSPIWIPIVFIIVIVLYGLGVTFHYQLKKKQEEEIKKFEIQNRVTTMTKKRFDPSNFMKMKR